MNEPLARFIGLYQQLDKQQFHRLPEVYAEQVIFTDPAHRIEGLVALGDYFAALYQRLAYCRFTITSQQQGAQAWLGWTMTFSHPGLRGGELAAAASGRGLWCVQGCSRLSGGYLASGFGQQREQGDPDPPRLCPDAAHRQK